MNELVCKKTKPRGRGKSIQHHLCVLGADRYLRRVYHRRNKPDYRTIYDVYEPYELLWAAKKAFRTSIKGVRCNSAMRELIHSYHSVKRILSYH